MRSIAPRMRGVGAPARLRRGTQRERWSRAEGPTRRTVPIATDLFIPRAHHPSDGLSSSVSRLVYGTSSPHPPSSAEALTRRGFPIGRTRPPAGSSSGRSRVSADEVRSTFTRLATWMTGRNAVTEAPSATAPAARAPTAATPPTPNAITFARRRPNWSPYRQAANSRGIGRPMRTSSVPSRSFANPTWSVLARSRVSRKARSHDSIASQRCSMGARFHRSQRRHTAHNRPFDASKARRRPTGISSMLSLAGKGVAHQAQEVSMRGERTGDNDPSRS